MAAPNSNAARITEIQTILRSGVKVDEVDGSRIEYDHDSLRKELRTLQQADPNYRARRPVASGIHLGGF